MALCALLACGPALLALDPDRRITQYRFDSWTAEDGLPRGPIVALGQDDEGYLRLSTGSEELRFDGLRFTRAERRVLAEREAPATLDVLPTELAESFGEVRDALRDRRGNLWVATAGAGLIRIVEGRASALGAGNGLPGDAVEALFEDREGNLWAATADPALIRLSDGDFVLYGENEGLLDDVVRSVFEDSRGALWIGTDGGGLIRLEGDGARAWTSADGLPGDVVLSLAEGPRGTLWIGTAGGGLSRLADGELTALDTTGLPSDIVTALLVDRRGDLWAGTLGGGVARLRDGSAVDIYDTGRGLGSNIVRALLEDRAGDLWVGTDDGLSRIAAGDGAVRNYTTADGLASPFVLSLLEDGEGRLWVGTDSGLSLLVDGGFASLTAADGLHNEVLYQLLEDDQGSLWACSNRGVFSLRKSQIEQLLGGVVERLAPTPLAGSRPHECNGFSQPASWAGDDGELWFSTIDGLLEVRPDELEVNPLPAPVVIEEVRVDFRALDLAGEPVLPAASRSFEFRFTALSLTDPQRILFSHRLLPFESDWTPPDDRRVVRYTNLPPGDYRFQLTAANEDGLWNPRPTELAFTLEPPFYRTAPFYLLAVLAIIGLSAALHQVRFRRLKERNVALEATISRRTAKVLDQKEELGRVNRRLAQTNRQLRRVNDELANLDRENADFLAIAAHDLRGPLVNLKGFAGEIRGTLGELGEVLEATAGRLSPSAETQVRHALLEDAPEALGFIDSSTERMDQLIDALLALSQLGRQKLVLEPIDMRALVNETLRSLTYQISRNRVRVTVAELPPVIADRASMKQVMENLLNNAVNYLRPDRPGRVEVSGERRGSEVLVRVRDNGRGIDPAQSQKVFKIFGRAGNTDVPGEGVGLAFVRTIIERHGGRIWFDSEVGEGTVFSFTLPHRRASPRKAADER